MSTAIEGFRLSPQQRRTWLAGGAADGCRAVVLADGAGLDVATLRRALDALVARHEILRTAFPRPAGVKLPLQAIQAGGQWGWRELEPAAGSLAPEELEPAVRRLLAAAPPPFQPAVGPALTVTRLQLAATRQLLLVDLPALCADAWTLDLFARELAALYGLSREAAAAGDEEVVQYLQYAEWQNELLEQDAGPARSASGAAPAPPALPGERPAATATAAAAAAGDRRERASHCFDAGAGAAAALPRLAEQAQVGVAAVLLACWQALLARLSGQAELVVDVVFANRGVPELAQTWGPFARSAAVRCFCTPGQTVSDAVARAAGALADAEEAAALPDRVEAGPAAAAGAAGTAAAAGGSVGFELLPPVARTPAAGGPVFAVLRRHVPAEGCKLKLTCSLEEGRLSCSLDYDPARLPAAEASRLSGQFAALLASALSAPGAALRDLDYLGEAERRQLVVELNRTAAPFPAERCLHELIAERAREAPAAIAVAVLGGAAAAGGSAGTAAGTAAVGGELSYGELEARANRLARHLVGLGVGADGRVGLLLRRSPELVVALLAALKAGAAYVPLDPSYPRARLGYLLADCAPAVVVTTRELAGLVEGAAGAAGGGAAVVCLDAAAEAAAIAAQPAAAPASAAVPANLAYVIYTSGSTGQPKGVMVPHRALVNYLSWCVSAYEMAGGSGAPVHSPLGFDLTVTSLLGPLLAGRRALLIDEEQGTEGLAAALRGGSFSLAKLTPSHLKLLAAEREAAPSPVTSGSAGGADREAGSRGVRTLVVGGEALLGDAAAPWVGGGVRLVNEYGPTETVVGCCVYEVGEDEEAMASGGAVPIGGPIANTRLYVLDGALRPVPRWVAGELCVGGEGVTRGYWRRPEATAASFVPDPFAGDGSRLYRTGDLALFRGDGALVFAGRRDDQVKIRGYRIELGEIEQALLAHPAVREAAVVAREEAAGERRLVAYLGSGEAAPPGVDELRRHLGERLPEYMLPAAFVVLAALPLNAHGKIDRAALPAPDAQRPELEQAYVAPRTATEELLAGVWSQVLGVERVGVHDSFFALGGDSMRSVQAAAQARERGLAMELQDLFRHPTVARLAAMVDERAGGAAGAATATPAPPAEVAEGELEAILSQVEGLSEEETLELLRERLQQATSGSRP